MDEGKSQTGVRNPYAPPAAPVADAPQTDERGKRPIQVAWAVALFGVDLAFSVLQAGLGWNKDPGLLANLLTAGLSAVFLIFEAWVIVKISAGRNWARWVALVAVGVGVPLVFITLAQTAQTSSRDVAWDGVATCADVIALYLLFFTPGREWFKRRLA